MESNILETMRKDEAYYPGEKMSDPLQNGNEYDWNSIIDMLFDLEKQSSFYLPFDELNLLTQNVSEGKMEDGQVINLIVSDSLK